MAVAVFGKHLPRSSILQGQMEDYGMGFPAVVREEPVMIRVVEEHEEYAS